MATTLQLSGPIVLVALGGAFAQRAGIFHLGLEGLMLIGAFVAVLFTIHSGNVWVGVVGAILVDLLISFVYWALIDHLGANAIIAGLGLSGIAVGATDYLSRVLYGTQDTLYAPVGLPHPVGGIATGLGAVISDVSVVTLSIPVMVFSCWLILRRSRFGLRVAAVGEYPFAAVSAGVPVLRIRLYALLWAGLFCAVGGAEIALGSLHSFTSDMTNGRGYLALTAVVFARGSPFVAAAAAFFFGVAFAAGVEAQISGGFLAHLPVDIVLMLPYVVTIIAVAASRFAHRRETDLPVSFVEQPGS